MDTTPGGAPDSQVLPLRCLNPRCGRTIPDNADSLYYCRRECQIWHAEIRTGPRSDGGRRPDGIDPLAGDTRFAPQATSEARVGQAFGWLDKRAE